MALALAVLAIGLQAVPAIAEPSLQVELSNEPETLPSSDEGMFYTATVKNTASGNPSVGDTLTCETDASKWSGVPDDSALAFRWLRNGVEIPGEEAKTYVVGSADEGQGLQCKVTGTNPNARAVAAAGRGASTKGSTVITSVTTSHGSFAVGQFFRGTGIPAGTTIVAVGAGTLELSAAATLSSSDESIILGVAPAAFSASAAAVSLPPVVVNPQPATLPPLPTKDPRVTESRPSVVGAVSGSGFISSDGEKLICKAPTNWTPGAAFSYQWLRNGTPIAGETSSEYTPVESEDKLAMLQCEVRAESGSGIPPSGGVAVNISQSILWFVTGTVNFYAVDSSVVSPSTSQVPALGFANTLSGPVDLNIELPSGREVVPFSVDSLGTGWNCISAMPTSEAPGRVSCTREGTLGPGSSFPSIKLAAYLGDDAPDVGIATATISGGGSPSSSDQATYTFTPGLSFGALADSFEAKVSDQKGADHTAAGGHPFSAYSTFGFNIHKTVLRTVEPTEQIKDVVVAAPRGFVGNALATPEYCKTVEEVILDICPPRSAVGGIYVFAPPTGSVGENNPYPTEPSFQPDPFPIYSIEPEFGQPAQFSFAPFDTPYTFVPELRAEEGYAISFRTAPIIQIPRLFGTEVFLCGFGAKVAGDSFKGCRKPTEAGANPEPLITNPTRCSGPPPTSSLQIDSWQHPEDVKTYDFSAAQITDCEEVEFEPEAQLTPTNRQAASPTGLEVEIEMDTEGVRTNTGVSQANLNTATVTFPKGMSINAAAAEGLEACTLAEVKLQSNVPHECPEASKVGEIEIDTPLIRETLKGAVYLAAQNDNPFAETIALYMVFSSARDGVIIKIAGKLEPDPKTGQLVSTFTENPEAPFSRLVLKFNSGPRAPLINPPKCGGYSIRAEFSPWSALNPANPTKDEIVVDNSKYKVSTGPGGGPCPRGDLEPKLKAGLTDPTAAAKSPFLLSLSREDGSQLFTGVQVANPLGLTAYLKGVEICPESSLAKVSSAEGAGAAEHANPSCPPNSLVGVAEAGSGAGPVPFYVRTGRVYLAGPYKGAPISLAIVTPALAGPYDLGSVSVRTPLYVDPTTSRVTAISDPIPTSLYGIDLNVREIRVALDRPSFTAAPTSCEPSSVDATVTGAEGASATVSNRFQVGGCERLGFKPRLSFRLFGGTKRGAHPKFRAILRPRPGDAAIASASVALPRSEFLENAHIRTICTRVQFAADECPKGSIYGKATATTPLLDHPVSGPVYLRSSSNELPDMVVALRGSDAQPIEVELAGRIDSVNGGIRSTFDIVPDQPVSSFVLTMQGGDKGLLVNSRNLCKGKPQKATAVFSAHNGKKLTLRPELRNACKGSTRTGGKKGKDKKPR
jgi:hypothetical protein